MSLLRRIGSQAVSTPWRTALAWPGGEMDYATLDGEVTRLAARLRATGAACVALAVDNGPAWAVADLAALSAGICLVPLPGFFSAAQVRHAFLRSGARGLLCEPGGPLDASSLDTGRAREVWEVAGRALAWRPLDCGESATLPAGVRKVTYTSGTTGEPKGVMLAWQHIRPVVESLAGAVGAGPGDRHLSLAPLSILLENIAGLYVPLWSGATAVLPSLADVGLRGSSELDPAVMAMALDTWTATSAIFFPQTLQALVEWIESGRSTPAFLRFAAVGGAPLSRHLLERAHDLGLPVYEGYGLSECASVVCLNTPDAWRVGSVGRPLPHVRLAVEEDGEVRVAGPGFAGYLGDEEAPGPWWATGDLGALDEDGFLHLQGRRRNVFITAFGRNVAPEWVENELTMEPAIAQAAVFGEARPWNAAVILAAPGAGPDAVDAALQRVNARLPDYARVRDWVPAAEPFAPGNDQVTGTDRIRREAIRARYAGPIGLLYAQEQVS